MLKDCVVLNYDVFSVYHSVFSQLQINGSKPHTWDAGNLVILNPDILRVGAGEIMGYDAMALNSSVNGNTLPYTRNCTMRYL